MLGASFHCDAIAGNPSNKIRGRLIVLERTWKGEEDKGQGPQEVVMTYAMTAAGSALSEPRHPGVPQ